MTKREKSNVGKTREQIFNHCDLVCIYCDDHFDYVEDFRDHLREIHNLIIPKENNDNCL